MNHQTISATQRELAKPMPKALLIPITKILQAISEMSVDAASIPELLDALQGRFDCDTMMLYNGATYSLAEAIDGNSSDEFGGFNARGDLICELFNCQYWREPVNIFLGKFNQVSPHEILMRKADGLTLAMRLWEFFVPDQKFDYDHFKALTSRPKKPSQVDEDATIRAGATLGIDVDPSDLPAELDAANLAFRAVLNGYGEARTTFKNRLIDYIQKNFSNLNNEAVQRIATVANPDKGRGRKKRDTE